MKWAREVKRRREVPLNTSVKKWPTLVPLETRVDVTKVIKSALQILLLSAWQLFVEKSMKITDPSPRFLFVQFSTDSSSPPRQQ